MVSKTYWITRKGIQRSKIIRKEKEFSLIKEDGLVQYRITGEIDFIYKLRNVCEKIINDHQREAVNYIGELFHGKKQKTKKR